MGVTSAPVLDDMDLHTLWVQVIFPFNNNTLLKWWFWCLKILGSSRSVPLLANLHGQVTSKLEKHLDSQVRFQKFSWQRMGASFSATFSDYGFCNSFSRKLCPSKILIQYHTICKEYAFAGFRRHRFIGSSFNCPSLDTASASRMSGIL